MLELAGAYCEKRKQQSTVILWQPNPREQFQAELETRPSTHLTTTCSPQPAAICKTDEGPTGLAVDRVWSFWSLWRFRECVCVRGSLVLPGRGNATTLVCCTMSNVQEGTWGRYLTRRAPSWQRNPLQRRRAARFPPTHPPARIAFL